MSVVYATGGVATLELETLDGPPPSVRVTLSGVASATVFSLTRTCEGQSKTVPGWRAKTVNDSVVYTDWCAPLNRSVTYTLLVNGQVVAYATITLTSATAWLQDPLQPDKSVAVQTNGRAAGALTLTGDSLKQIDFAATGTPIQILGSSEPVYFGGQRMTAKGITLGLRSNADADTAAFRTMADGSPILLLRTIPSMVALPPLAYLNAAVSQRPLTKHQPGGQQQVFLVTGDLIAAVTQAAITGSVTYDQVAQLLAGYTYDQVQAKSASVTYLDWAKNPLIISTL